MRVCCAHGVLHTGEGACVCVPMEANKGLLVCCSITLYLTPLEQGLSLTPEVYWWPWSLTSCWGYSFRAVSVGSRNSRLQVVTLMLTLSQHPCSLLGWILRRVWLQAFYTTQWVLQRWNQMSGGLLHSSSTQSPEVHVSLFSEDHGKVRSKPALIRGKSQRGSEMLLWMRPCIFSPRILSFWLNSRVQDASKFPWWRQATIWRNELTSALGKVMGCWLPGLASISQAFYLLCLLQMVVIFLSLVLQPP